MSEGTLREQLLYPGRVRVPDDVLREYLELVDLGDLPERNEGGFDAEINWATALSLGEQQRVAIVRALCSGCEVLVLDEATSALDDANAARIYRLLKERGHTIISVAQRDLVKHHDKVLLFGGRTPRLLSSEEYSALEAA